MESEQPQRFPCHRSANRLQLEAKLKIFLGQELTRAADHHKQLKPGSRAAHIVCPVEYLRARFHAIHGHSMDLCMTHGMCLPDLVPICVGTWSLATDPFTCRESLVLEVTHRGHVSDVGVAASMASRSQQRFTQHAASEPSIGTSSQPAGVDVSSVHSKAQVSADLVEVLRSHLKEAQDASDDTECNESCVGKAGIRKVAEWTDRLGRKNPHGGYLATYLKKDFSAEKGYEVTPSLFGCKKLTELLRLFPNYCEIQTSPGGHVVLYPPRSSVTSPGKHRCNTYEDIKRILQDRLAEIALLHPRGFRLSTLGQFLRDRFGYTTEETLPGVLKCDAERVVKDFAGLTWEPETTLPKGNKKEDLLLLARIDPLGDLTEMLKQKLANCAAQRLSKSQPRIQETEFCGYQLERMKNDFMLQFGYVFRHDVFGYSRLLELVSDLLSHIVSVDTPMSDSRKSGSLVRPLLLPVAQKSFPSPIMDLRRLLVEKSRILANSALQAKKGCIPARLVYYLGNVKPDFIKRFGYAFDAKSAGFRKIALAVESQSDICYLVDGDKGQKILEPTIPENVPAVVPAHSTSVAHPGIHAGHSIAQEQGRTSFSTVVHWRSNPSLADRTQIQPMGGMSEDHKYERAAYFDINTNDMHNKLPNLPAVERCPAVKRARFNERFGSLCARPLKQHCQQPLRPLLSARPAALDNQQPQPPFVMQSRLPGFQNNNFAVTGLQMRSPPGWTIHTSKHG